MSRADAHVLVNARESNMTTTSSRRAHWDGVHETRCAQAVSWFQPSPDMSLKLIRRTAVPRDARIIDVGGGASTLVDHLLAQGYADLTVLDTSEAALRQTQARLGAQAGDVAWAVADVTSWQAPAPFNLWHDRAVLHFLTEPGDQAGYANVVSSAVPAEGWAVIGGFAPGGPTTCSGLPVVQHDAESLGALLGPRFQLLEVHGEVHITPSGAEQAFRYHVFRRKS